MSTISGLPAHILLNHLVVVLAPLTAILLIVCALWVAARQRLIWLLLVLAVVTAVVTPLTVKAGEWLGDRVPETPDLDTHMNAGELATWLVALPLLAAAILLAGLHVVTDRGRAVQPVLRWAVAVVVIAAAGATMFEIHHIGESGARAAWGGFQDSSGTG